MKDDSPVAITTESSGSISAPYMTTSRDPLAKMSSLHRRQSALNLPSRAIGDAASPGMRPTLSLSNVQDDQMMSQGVPSPTHRRYRDKMMRFSAGRSSSSRQFPSETSPELYDSQMSILSDSQCNYRTPQTGSASHLRTLSRDFVLPALPPSSVQHEDLTSLKDQFLKIKERFSPSALSLSSTPPATVVLPPGETIASTTDVLSKQGVVDQNGSEGSWELPQARVERWYREDNFFKACITCWNMEAGAAIVSKIARVVSEWVAPSIVGASVINPDVSLQWIGRQLWAVTVSLPLTRSGDLHAEHISLAHRINEAVAQVSEQTHTRSTENLMPATTASHADNVDNRENIEPQSVQPLALSSQLTDSDDGELVLDKTSPAQASSCVTLEAEDIEMLRAQKQQMAGKEDSGSDEGVTGADKRNDDGPTDQCQNDDDNDEEEDNSERVSALPLSWSMLSLSSQPSGSSEHASMQGEFTIADENGIADPVAHLAPEKTGWLKKKKRKQHGLGSAWQPRYFELKGNRLYYFASEADGLPRGAVLLDHALVQRGRGDHAMAFSISSATSRSRLQVLKFSARLTHQVLPRKSIELRVPEETDAAVGAWVTALNRASFYCNLASGTSSTLPAHTSLSFESVLIPDRQRKTPFYRFRSPSAAKAALASASLPLPEDRKRQNVYDMGAKELRTRWKASYQQLGSVQYLRDTDPLLWEIHPPEQIAIRKKAARARTRSDYLAIFSRHSETFAQIFLPRPQPISLEQTLRDILPELFLINDTLYGGGEQQQAAEQSGSDSTGQPVQNRGLEHIFEVLDTHILRFAAAAEERVRAVSALLQACARTISGGDSYFVVHRLLGNPNLIIRPAEARGRPIEIDVSPDRPSHFLITVFSAFSFHLLDDVERFGDSNDASGGGMTPAPLLRVRTRHIQEFDFASGTSTRWLKIDVEGRKEDGSPGGCGSGGGSLGRWGSRRQSHEGAESRIGALLDALS